MLWKDNGLTWTPSDFGGISKVELPSTKIFTPDIMAYFQLPLETSVMETMVIASSDGSIIWVPPVQMTSLCPGLVPGVEDITCEIKMGSWVNSERILNIEESDKYLDMEIYVPHAKWDLVDASAERKVKFYPCCANEGYPQITFSLKFRRVEGYSSGTTVGLSLSMFLVCLVSFLL
jgi:hypothetical protein